MADFWSQVWVIIVAQYFYLFLFPIVFCLLILFRAHQSCRIPFYQMLIRLGMTALWTCFQISILYLVTRMLGPELLGRAFPPAMAAVLLTDLILAIIVVLLYIMRDRRGLSEEEKMALYDL